MSLLTIGTILRVDSKFDRDQPTADGLPNYWHLTRPPAKTDTHALLDEGINRLARVGKGASERCPAIILRSNPHLVGSAKTPWQDILEPDLGYAIYHGDNKSLEVRPEDVRGNRALLDLFKEHQAADEATRANTTPIVLFRGIRHAGKDKGHLMFQGFGIVERVELITQYDDKHGYFPNYSFTLALFSLAAENEQFDWGWINRRRDPSLTVAEANRGAPVAWRIWVKSGNKSLDRIRRRVAKQSLVDAKDQHPDPKTHPQEAKALAEICAFYATKKHSFEALAAEVTARIFRQNGARYNQGWLTKRSGEGGIDFVGRLELGSAFARVKVVVLGQAKCERDSATSGRDIARTVARLRRGWIGAYVTTGYFSRPVQAEVVDDEYPLLLVHGLRLATETIQLARENGQTVAAFLQAMDQKYAGLIQDRRPEEVLHDVAGLPVDPTGTVAGI